MVDRFEVLSSVANGRGDSPPGTLIVARKWVDTRPHSTPFDCGVWTRPIAGLSANGDSAAIVESGRSVLIALAGGLGHGPDAALASEAATGFIRRHHDRDFEWLFDRLNGILRHTRGAAIALARIDLAERRLVHGAVGNVEMRVYPVPERHHAARPGIVGVAAAPRPRVREFAWSPGAMVALYSDGIAEGWNLGATAKRASHHASLMSHLIARDHARSTDDATVVVVRERGV